MTKRTRKKVLGVVLLSAVVVIFASIYGDPVPLVAADILRTEFPHLTPTNVRGAGTAGGSLALYKRYCIAFDSPEPGTLRWTDKSHDLGYASRTYEGFLARVQSESDTIEACKRELKQSFPEESETISRIGVGDVQWFRAGEHYGSFSVDKVLLTDPRTNRRYYIFHEDYQFSPGG